MKVNRCLTEGRRALAARLAAIESGTECVQLAPLLARLAAGETTPDDRRLLRPHMESCLSCRAHLRSLRAAIQRARRRDGLQ
jgi:hypothetical protein